MFPHVKEAKFDARKFENQILFSLFILSNFVSVVIIPDKVFWQFFSPETQLLFFVVKHSYK
jgi:hypothetical protein